MIFAQIHQYLILDTTRCIRCQLYFFEWIERIDRLDKPDRSDAHQVFDADTRVLEFARNIDDEPQIALDEDTPHTVIARLHPKQKFILLFTFERRRQYLCTADIINTITFYDTEPHQPPFDSDIELRFPFLQDTHVRSPFTVSPSASRRLGTIASYLPSADSLLSVTATIQSFA